MSIEDAVSVIRNGGLVVYPTEAVFGIGCDFRNHKAVEKLLRLKQRPQNKGLILVGSHLNHLLPLIKPEHPQDLARALKTWPGHHTWVFPASPETPAWITGQYPTVAVRLSAHKTVKKLCDGAGHALVSTSANLNGEPTPDKISELRELWGEQVDAYVDEALGGHSQASQIRMANDGQVIR